MKNKDDSSLSFKTLQGPSLFLILFFGIGIWRFTATGNIFYLFNFGYIGTALALGGFLNNILPKKHILWGRRITQILIGVYMLGYLGFMCKENMQIEGFFFYLLMGVFAGATLHYFIAKIIGTFFFNRGWCGWACWTAMILDLLPWKEFQNGRLRHLGVIRYIHFFLSLGLILYIWFPLGERGIYSLGSMAEVYWLALGNALYYIVGITLAGVLKDNRAFCKYVCPIPPLQKIGARFAILKIKINPDKCIDCGICEKHCPMNIKLLDYKNANQRILSTECILCTTCVNVCPQSAIDLKMNKFDIMKVEHLNYRNGMNIFKNHITK